MRDLELHALAADDRKVLAPVKLKRLAGSESQRDKGAAPCRLFVSGGWTAPSRL